MGLAARTLRGTQHRRALPCRRVASVSFDDVVERRGVVVVRDVESFAPLFHCEGRAELAGGEPQEIGGAAVEIERLRAGIAGAHDGDLQGLHHGGIVAKAGAAEDVQCVGRSAGQRGADASFAERVVQRIGGLVA